MALVSKAAALVSKEAVIRQEEAALKNKLDEKKSQFDWVLTDSDLLEALESQGWLVPTESPAKQNVIYDIYS